MEFCLGLLCFTLLYFTFPLFPGHEVEGREKRKGGEGESRSHGRKEKGGFQILLIEFLPDRWDGWMGTFHGGFFASILARFHSFTAVLSI